LRDKTVWAEVHGIERRPSDTDRDATQFRQHGTDVFVAHNARQEVCGAFRVEGYKVAHWAVGMERCGHLNVRRDVGFRYGANDDIH
jgi:hypothetical protein